MIFRKINDYTINCIITPQDLIDNGLQPDDLFERRGGAMEFLKSVIDRAAQEENVHITGEHTSMRLSVLPDRSLSLTLSDHPESVVDPAVARLVMEAIRRSRQSSDAGSVEDTPAAKQGQVDSGAVRRQKPEGTDGVEAWTDADRENAAVIPSYLFRFYSMSEVVRCCRYLSEYVDLDTALYEIGEEHLEDPGYATDRKIYLLELSAPEDGDLSKADFEHIVLTANEYGELLTGHVPNTAYLLEHATALIPSGAALTLGKL